MPPRRNRGRGRPPRGGPTRRSSRGATRAAAAPFPASPRGRRRQATHLVTDNQAEAASGHAGDTVQQSQTLPDSLNALLALVRSEVQRVTHLPPVMSSSGGSQNSVGAGQSSSASEAGGGQSTGQDGSTSSSQSSLLIRLLLLLHVV